MRFYSPGSFRDLAAAVEEPQTVKLLAGVVVVVEKLHEISDVGPGPYSRQRNELPQGGSRERRSSTSSQLEKVLRAGC